MTLTPAYGADYKSQKEVKAALDEGKDFIINDITSRWNGLTINKADLKGTTFRVRYAKLRKVMEVTL